MYQKNSFVIASNLDSTFFLENFFNIEQYNATDPKFWIRGSEEAVFVEDEIHIWRATIPLEIMHLQEIIDKNLSTEEIVRLNKFHFEIDRLRFTTSRICLKNILSRYLICQASSINFQYTRYGKPFLKSHPLQFNVSHSGNYILYALSKKTIMGIDIEYQKDLDFLAIAKEFCTHSEYIKLSNTTISERKIAFYRCWTRKEAFTKAIGLGLHYPLDKVEVNFLVNELPEIRPCNFPNITRETKDLLRNSTWKSEEIHITNDYVATLVSRNCSTITGID